MPAGLDVGGVGVALVGHEVDVGPGRECVPDLEVQDILHEQVPTDVWGWVLP